jgi:hypothetical protein
MRLGLLLALLLVAFAGCEDDDYGKDGATNRDMTIVD